MLFVLFLLSHAGFMFAVADNRLVVINDFIVKQERAATVAVFCESISCKLLYGGKGLFKNTIRIGESFENLRNEDHVLFVADLNENYTSRVLYQAQNRNLFRIPSRWLLFLDYKYYNGGTSDSVQEVENESNIKRHVEYDFKEINVVISSEVYVAIKFNDEYRLHVVYKKKSNLPLIWEKYGVWTPRSGLIVSPWSVTLPMRRRDLEGLRVVATSVITNNYTIQHFEEYLHRDRDTFTKFTYYMVKHLFEWVNGSGVVNVTDTWGYVRDDGRYDGMVRELEDGRADLAGTPLVPSKERLSAMQFITPPAPMTAGFLFRKPALASVTNIFVLPFSRGVWEAVVALIALCSVSLIVTSYREQQYLTEERKKTLTQRISDGILDTLCLVFQQGTDIHPVSITARQILLLGLMAFMFLFTAYSANVVALLQTTTNEISSVHALLKSPLALGVQNVVYNKYYFPADTRPSHRALWRLKLKPQGEKAFLSAEDGIRRVREGMYAFHVEQTAGYDEIQRTFLENEKCNIGSVKFIEVTYPYFAISHDSHIKEQIRIGVRRLMESGVQSRSVRRIIASQPRCGASVAMFAAVTTGDVAPAFHCLLLIYAVAVIILIIEICVHRRSYTPSRVCNENIYPGCRTKSESQRHL